MFAGSRFHSSILPFFHSSILPDFQISRIPETHTSGLATAVLVQVQPNVPVPLSQNAILVGQVWLEDASSP